MGKCYVYAYRVDDELWIIGKGHGRRDQKHLARARRCAKGLPTHRIYGWQRELADRIKAGRRSSSSGSLTNLMRVTRLSVS
jgi:hypothetical protein